MYIPLPTVDGLFAFISNAQVLEAHLLPTISPHPLGMEPIRLRKPNCYVSLLIMNDFLCFLELMKGILKSFLSTGALKRQNPSQPLNAKKNIF